MKITIISLFEVFSAQEVNSSSKDDPGPAETELEKPLAIGDVLPVEEKSQFDSARASLLILQNLDDVLNNECLDNDDTPKEEISDISTDDQKKSKFHEFCSKGIHSRLLQFNFYILPTNS